MHEQLNDRFEEIRYKAQKLSQGNYVTTHDGSFYGYMTSSLKHLINAGVDVTGVSATIITDNENASVVEKGYLVEVEGNYVAIKKKIRYRDPFGAGYDTYEVLV